MESRDQDDKAVRLCRLCHPRRLRFAPAWSGRDPMWRSGVRRYRAM